MIEVQSLTRHYGKTVAVSDVSFRTGDSEVVGLLGHNGAGKTTIMRMLSGYLEPSAGSIHIDGIDLARHPRMIQRELGYLPENLPLYPEMLVADYLEYAATLRGVGRGERLAALQEVLAATDLRQRALDPIGSLSRGLKQRVGVAQAILGRPRLLILDEPTNGLDPGQTEHMRDLIRRLARRCTVILSTHILREVEAVCDRVLILREGRLALDRPMGELRHDRVLQLGVGGGADQLEPLLLALPEVAALERTAHPASGGDIAYFRLQLHPGADLDTAANNVARCVLDAGARLQEVRALEHDLDAVFREVTGHGD